MESITDPFGRRQPAGSANARAAPLERALAFMRASVVATADAVRSIEAGIVLSTPSLPAVWAVNQLRVASAPTFEELVELAEEQLAGLRLPADRRRASGSRSRARAGLPARRLEGRARRHHGPGRVRRPSGRHEHRRGRRRRRSARAEPPLVRGGRAGAERNRPARGLRPPRGSRAGRPAARRAQRRRPAGGHQQVALRRPRRPGGGRLHRARGARPRIRAGAGHAARPSSREPASTS